MSEIELIRYAYLGGAVAAFTAVVLLIEWQLRKRLKNGVPAWLRWLVRLLGLLGVAFVTAPALGILSFSDLVARVDGVMNEVLFSLGGQNFTLSGMLTFCVLYVATIGVSRLVRRAVSTNAALQKATDPGTLGAINRLVHYAVMAVGVAIALQVAGVNLSAFFAAGAAFAVGIGFALQGVAQNFVSGIILLIERSIKPGDIIEVEGETARVQRMGIRSTIVRNRFDTDLIVPNNTLAQATVKNYTLLDRKHRVEIGVGVAYESDLRVVFEALQQAGDAFESRDKEPRPLVLLRGFGASSVDFTLSVWTRDVWFDPRVQSELRLAVWDALAEAGITIAFPQLDVHMDVADEVALRVARGGRPPSLNDDAKEES